MFVVKLTPDQAKDIADALSRAHFEVLAAYDPIDDAVKFKIDGGTWSPPFKDRTGSQ